MIHHNFKKHVASGVIIILGAFLLIILKPYFSALFAALIAFILLKPVYHWIREKTFIKQRHVAASVVLILMTIFILLPTIFVGQIMVREVNEISTSLSSNGFAIGETIVNLEDAFLEVTGRPIPVEQIVKDVAGKFLGSVGSSLSSLAKSATKFLLSVSVYYFALFYLLINSGKLSQWVRKVLPFNAKNSEVLAKKFKRVSNAMVLGLGLTAVVQGFLVAIGFIIFGVPAPALWGFAAGVLSFLPLVGSALIYVPAGLILMALGNVGAGIGLLAWGLILVAQSDNLVRIIVGKVVANIHPLIVLLGVFVGLPVFGLLGVIIGPLLISYFFDLLTAYRSEFA